jgi:hypothetical protein
VTIVVTVSVRPLHLCADGIIAARTGKDGKNVAEEWHDREGSREVVVVSGGGIVEEPTQCLMYGLARRGRELRMGNGML